MSFGFGNTGSVLGGGSSGAAGVNQGPDLETIQTEALGFLSINGDAKVRLTSSWTSLPAETASLLSIASRRGLVAAAGPNEVVIASTEAVRKGFEAPKDGGSDIRGFEPQIRIPMSTRVSHIAFTADESYLLLSAESGGGLAAYDVQQLMQGSKNSAFELSTQGESLRALVPNPTAEKAELVAIVTTNGNLSMANLQQNMVTNALKTQVSCVSWSSKGKQLCAGLADGTISQMTPEGQGKGDIPAPPGVTGCHVSSLTWLENNLFLSIHTSANTTPPSSVYHIINRQPPSTFTFQKISDPIPPFSDKAPQYSILRLRDFQPALQDLLLVSSTATSDVGLLSRSKTPLASDMSADAITGVFTTTELLDDTRRPTLPFTESMDDSTAVGISLDLSSQEKVFKPIPSDEELEESPGPLPGLWILTHEGILCSWWLVYNDSMRQGTTYAGMTVASGETPAPAMAQPQAAPTTAASPFGNSGGSAFGSSSKPSALGAASQIGQKSSPWGAAAANNIPSTSTGGAVFGSSSFGSSAAPSQAPAFGQPSAIGFGQSSQIGAKASPWASAAGGSGGGAGSTPAFGQSGFGSFAKKDNQAGPFGSVAGKADSNAPSSSGGFAGFASKGGFGSVAGANSGSSVFGGGDKPSGSPFGTSTSTSTAFAPNQENKSGGGVFGSTPFKLQSSFKPDPSSSMETSKPQSSSGSMFGNAFGSALSEAQNQPLQSTSRDEDMDTMESHSETPQAKPASIFSAPSGAKPESSIFGQASKPAASGGIFGTPKPDASKPTGFSSVFGKSSLTDTPPSKGFSFTETPKAKEQEEEAPLPPDATSKMAYPLGDSSSSSAASNAPSQPYAATTTPSKPEAAPLPPDFTTTPASTSKAEAAPLPPDFFSTTPKSTPAAEAPLPPDFTKTPKTTDAPLPPDFLKDAKPTEKKPEAAPMPPDLSKPAVKNPFSDAPLSPDPPKTIIKNPFTDAALPRDSSKPAVKNPFADVALPRDPSKPAVKNPFAHIAPPPEPDSESEEDEEDDEPERDDEDDGNEEDEDAEDGEEDDELEPSDSGVSEATEGSGIDVAKDLSPSTSGLTTQTPGFTPQSSFSRAALISTTPATARADQDRSKTLFGEVNLNAPLFPRPSAPSPRSPSPVRGSVPHRVLRNDSVRSVSAPGMASQILGPRTSQYGINSIMSRDSQAEHEDPILLQHRRMKERKEAEETRPLVDEEDDEIQRILISDVPGTLELDEFIAHSNVNPPAQESIPAQVEAVYRDINSMIDTLGLNARTVKAFVKGHTENAYEEGRTKADLEISDDWVLCEVDQLGNILDKELYPDLEEGRVQDLEDKTNACNEMARDMHRLRAKQEDLKRIIMARMDPDQAEAARTLPLSAEQATQQSELRREFTQFTKLLADAEEALTLLRARIASASGAAGKGSSNVPTVEAVIRTITKMTTMVEKRSGDVDVLETQLRKLRLGSTSREGSPMMTPQGKRHSVFSPESTPSRNLRHSLTSSVTAFGSPARATPPRKKVSGFSKEEKGDLMEKRARRQAVLDKLKGSIEKKGVHVWNMEDID